MPSQPVISEDYLKLQQELHKNLNYGVASTYYAPLVKELIVSIGATSISDFGAGKKRLYEALNTIGVKIDYYPYDPAFSEYGKPLPADLVCCIDVFEHVEQAYVDNVIAQLVEITLNTGFFTVSTGPAKKKLPDGRNAHITQQPPAWWLNKFVAFFEIVRFEKCINGFWLVTKPVGQHSSSISAHAIQQTANVYHQEGDLQNAKQLYQLVLQIRPDHPEANYGLGIISVQTHQAAAGLAYFKRALDLDSTQQRYWFSYIEALIRAGQTDQAKQVLAFGRQGGLQGKEVDLLAEKLVGII